MPDFDHRQLRDLFGCFATGITVITLRLPDGAARGITVNSFASVSLDPPLVSFCLGETVKFLPLIKTVSHYAINILAETQEPLSRHFAQREQAVLPADHFAPDVMGCPILHDTLGWMVCRPAQLIPAGDHQLVLGEVVQYHHSETTAKPLLYFRSRYHRL